MKNNRTISLAIALALVFLLTSNFLTTTMSTTIPITTQNNTPESQTLNLPPGQTNMTFTSDVTLNLTTGTTINLHTGKQMTFTTGIKFQFQPVANPMMQPCFLGTIIGPVPQQLVACTWWEVEDLGGNPTGIEFHVDQLYPGNEFHVDMVSPGPSPIPIPALAELKIDAVNPCDNFVVPSLPLPAVCSWWEILSPPQWAGVEFHVDSTTGSNGFHVDQVTNVPPPIIPWPYQVVAELKISGIKPCDKLTVSNLAVIPTSCTWWEITAPQSAKGYEFHVDVSYPNGTIHIDSVTPGNIVFPTPVYEVTAEAKISSIIPCTNLQYISPSGYVPQPCDWWEIIYPASLKGYEFHIDTVNGQYIHIDDVYPHSITGIQIYKIVVERKIKSMSPCDWFKVVKPASWAPDPCSWWKIIKPAAWNGITFHVDQNNTNTYKFHVDTVNGGAFPPQTPPPWNVTAEPSTVHDVAVTAVTPMFASLYKGWPDPIDVTVQNEGDFTETFSVSVYYDSNHVTTSPITVSSLPAHTSKSLRFWWIANALPAIYNIYAEASAVPGETDLADNAMRDGTVTILAPPQFYYKAGFADYAPSGMPDFDQRQDQWDNPPGSQTWTWCGPVAAANSLWWLDSKFEPAQPPISPPTISDGFPLVSSYVMGIDDHDPANVQRLVQHLAYLMDTDGLRTHLVHSGTNVIDMESGLTHYLSWTGVNPQGDVNGDGTVNMTDANIVNAAMGKVPGMLGWNMAADIFPATTGWPVQMAADNVINLQDLNLVTANLGRTGFFYEHTEDKPDFYYIEREVEKSQDVVLLLGYWYWTGTSWYREGGHFVTVAGVNSTQLKLAISDPALDAFESVLIPEGRVPIPHMHPPIEPPYMTHNDAAYVSHDIYNVMQIGLPFPPCPGGTWTLVNYAGWKPTPPFFTVIESAVITSPLGTHDVAVIDVHNMKKGCIPRATVCQKMNCSVFVTVENQGDFTETFNVTAYANTTAIGKQTVTINSKQNTTLTFTWMTTGLTEYMNYTISATADTVTAETDFADNTLVDGTVTLTHTGDITGDGKVDIQDLSRVSGAFGSLRVNDPRDPQYGLYKHPVPCPTCPHQPNTDLTGDKKVDIQDLSRTSANFGWHR